MLNMQREPHPLVENLEAFVGFVRKRVGDPDLAADLVQESLLKALKSEKVPESERMIPWFYRILRNSIIDLYRRNDVQQRAKEHLISEAEHALDAETETSLCQCFRRLLPALPEPYQEVLQRLDLDGVSPTVLAEELNVSLNSLNVRLHRARKRLKAELESTCNVCSKHGCLDCTCGTSKEIDS